MVAGKKVEFWAPNLGTKKPSDFSTIRMGLHSLAWDGLMLLILDVCKCALLKEAACNRFHEC